MPSFEDQFYLENPSRLQALGRDLRLLLMLARYAIAWLTKGARVRRAYARAQSDSEPLALEDVVGD